MTKDDFLELMLPILKPLSINKKVELLKKIQKEWIPELVAETLKGYIKCPNCHKYYLEKAAKEEQVHEIYLESTFITPGYGDVDNLGKLEYLVTYSICPICNERHIKSKYFLQVIK